MTKYREGCLEGQSALRNRGGTRGAEWHADQYNLEGEDRIDFIEGFNAAFDENDEASDY